MKHASIVLSFLFVLWGQNIPTRAQQHTTAKQELIGGGCDGCEAIYIGMNIPNYRK